MMRKSIFSILFILFLVAGCSDTESSNTEYQQQINQLTKEVETLKEAVATQEEKIASIENFSYLEDFTPEEKQAYQAFLADYDLTHLKNYSPEKMVLLYYQLLMVSDLEGIYAITYNDGTLPDYASFSEAFYASDLNHSENEALLRFRNYDTIRIREENKTDEYVMVEMDISYGAHHAVQIYSLRKINNQWQIELQHLL